MATENEPIVVNQAICIERRRLEAAEDSISEVKNDLTEIKDTLYSIDKEIRLDLNKLSQQFSEFTVVMQGIAVRGEERDKRTSEIFCENRASFERFSSDIRKLEDKLVEHAKEDVRHDNKLSNLTMLVNGVIVVLGTIGGFVLQQYLNR
jgi:hypothetical protein